MPYEASRNTNSSVASGLHVSGMPSSPFHSNVRGGHVAVAVGGEWPKARRCRWLQTPAVGKDRRRADVGPQTLRPPKLRRRRRDCRR